MKRTPLRPKRRANTADAVKIYPDGREVCQNNAVGKHEYDWRKFILWLRQDKTCCLCGKWLDRDDVTFEHQDGRGMGGAKRDDRIWKDGQPYNGVAHGVCNTEKGSKRR